MGIYDRDYVRDRPLPRGGGPTGRFGIGSMSAWSMNTWIIVLCVLVYAIDGFTPTQWVMMGASWNPNLPRTMRSISDYDMGPINPVNPNNSVGQALLRDRQTGAVVGDVVFRGMTTLTAWLHFSTAKGFLGFEFWRFVGFQFLHASMTHLLFNMVALFFFGPMVERYLGSKRYLAFYLLAGICGAMMYLILNLGGYAATIMANEPVRIPGLLFENTHTPLIGASAGVFGVLMAGAYLAPNATVLLFFIFPMPLRTLAYALVGVAFLTVVLSGHNAGGEAAHLGGAIAGFYFIRHPHHLHNFFDVLGWLDPTSHHYKHGQRTRGRAVAKMRRAQGGASPAQAEVDRILDKVHSEGLASLTEKEKRILREASERGR